MKDSDARFADVSYYLGIANIKMEKLDAASASLFAAKDCDALPFRARSYIARSCREIAQKENILLADFENYFLKKSLSEHLALPQFIDHVHPDDSGYYEMALYLAKLIHENNTLPKNKSADYPSLQECHRILNIKKSVIDKVEFDFTNLGYIKRLSHLNPKIQIFLSRVRERAEQDALRLGYKSISDIKYDQAGVLPDALSH